MPNEKSAAAAAMILTKRPDIRDAVRQAFKLQGLKPDSIHSFTEEKELLNKIGEIDYAMLVLDWEHGPDKVMNVLTQNRKQSRLESYPVFLLAAHEDDNIMAMAREYFITYIAIGQVTMDTIREQIKGLVRDYQNLSPVRKVMMAVEEARQAGDVKKVTQMLKQIHEKHPSNQRIALELAECLIHDNDWAGAEALLKNVVNQEDCYARAKHLYARCRLKQGDHTGAIDSLKGAQLINPYNVERLLEMGNIFLKLDQPEEAENSFNAVLEFAPEAKDAKVGKSTSKLLMGEINEALNLLNEFANPRELSAVFNTAAILAIRQKRYETGFELYQKAAQVLAKKPKLVSRIFYNMGIGYVKSGDSEKGLSCFEKSAEADPEFKDASYNIKVLKTSSKTKAAAGGGDDVDVLDVLEERFTSAMPSSEGETNQEEEVQFDDMLGDIGKFS